MTSLVEHSNAQPTEYIFTVKLCCSTILFWVEIGLTCIPVERNMSHIQKSDFSKIEDTKTIMNNRCSDDLKVSTKNHFHNDKADV